MEKARLQNHALVDLLVIREALVGLFDIDNNLRYYLYAPPDGLYLFGCVFILFFSFF